MTVSIRVAGHLADESRNPWFERADGASPSGAANDQLTPLVDALVEGVVIHFRDEERCNVLAHDVATRHMRGADRQFLGQIRPARG